MTLQKYGDVLNEDYLVHRLAERAARVSFLTGVFLTQSLLGLTWQGWRNVVTDRWAIGQAQKLARRLAYRLRVQPFRAAEAPLHHLLPLYMAANPSIYGKAREIVKILKAVGHEELDSLRLPAPLFGLYYPYRQMRLLKNYLMHSRRGGETGLR